MTNAYNAGQNIGAVLGDLLTGKNREPGKAYYDALGQGYEIQGKKSRSEEAFEKASIARSMNLARDGINADVLARARAGDKAAEAELGAAILRSAQTPNLRNYTGGALDLQELGNRDAAVEAGIGELGAMNGHLAGVARGPIKTNAIDSGYQLNPYKPGAAVPTAGENAKIEELGAREHLSDVKAAGGGFAPKAPKGSKIQERKGTLEDDVAAIEDELGRPLSKVERTEYLTTGKVKIKPEAPAAAASSAGKAPAGVDATAYAKATQKKADALAAIKRGAPKDKVAARLKEQGYPKLAAWIMGAKQGG